MSVVILLIGLCSDKKIMLFFASITESFASDHFFVVCELCVAVPLTLLCVENLAKYVQ